jgi:hypothetical protein
MFHHPGKLRVYQSMSLLGAIVNAFQLAVSFLIYHSIAFHIFVRSLKSVLQILICNLKGRRYLSDKVIICFTL